MRVASVLCSLALAIGCAAAFATEGGEHTGEMLECIKNFSVQGSAISPDGTVYSTEAAVAGVSKTDAVARAATKLTADGLVVITSDVDAGLVVATNRVANGKGEVSILEIKFKELGPRQIVVGLRFPIRAALITSDSYLRDRLCQVIAAVRQ